MRARVILMDAPWPFRVWSKATGNGRSAESHYRTMTWDDLHRMGDAIDAVAATDCALALWVCRPSQHEALAMVDAWNDRPKSRRWQYKTELFTWIKTTKAGNPSTGMGYWTRANTEAVWLFTRGRPVRASRGVSQVVMAPRTKHSAKPDAVQDRIEQLFGASGTPRLEVFARRARTGWTCIGNELTGRDIFDDLARLCAGVPDEPMYDVPEARASRVAGDSVDRDG